MCTYRFYSISYRFLLSLRFIHVCALAATLYLSLPPSLFLSRTWRLKQTWETWKFCELDRHRGRNRARLLLLDGPLHGTKYSTHTHLFSSAATVVWPRLFGYVCEYPVSVRMHTDHIHNNRNSLLLLAIQNRVCVCSVSICVSRIIRLYIAVPRDHHVDFCFLFINNFLSAFTCNMKEFVFQISTTANNISSETRMSTSEESSWQ